MLEYECPKLETRKEQRDYMYASYELNKGNIDEGIAKVQALIKTNKQKCNITGYSMKFINILITTQYIAMFGTSCKHKGSDFPEETKKRAGSCLF